jgi:3-carboxy-cis,cis-muconate cycloisomerase
MVSSYLSATVQEHERAVGASQSELPTIAAVIQAAGVAVASVAEITEELSVDSAQMRLNIEATLGTIFAEKAMILLSQNLDRDTAHKLLEEATRKAVADKQPMARVLGAMPEVTRHIDSATLKRLDVAEDYLGSADAFRIQQLQSNLPTEKKD